MSGNDARRHLVPIVRRPFELVTQRRHRERGVGAASRDHNVCAAFQRFDNWCRADVRVGRQHAIANRRQRLARVHVREFVSGGEQFVDAAQQVVACDNANLELAAQPHLFGSSEYGGGTRLRIYTARIRNHLHSLVHDRRKHTLHRADEIARVTHFRVALLLLLQNRHRDFGEIVEHQIIDVSTFDLTTWCFQPIAPEALPAGDSYNAFGIRHPCSV